VTIRKLDNVFSCDLPNLNLPGIRAFMLDIMTSESKEKPMTCGLYRQEVGDPCPYNYETEEFKMLLEGEMSVTNDRGETYELKPGEILFFSKGEKVKFSSKSSGLAFYVAQR
jgi:uncharacterized cupin superfamily protein